MHAEVIGMCNCMREGGGGGGGGPTCGGVGGLYPFSDLGKGRFRAPTGLEVLS